jgi:hypothetical protein
MHQSRIKINLSSLVAVQVHKIFTHMKSACTDSLQFHNMILATSLINHISFKIQNKNEWLMKFNM